MSTRDETLPQDAQVAEDELRALFAAMTDTVLVIGKDGRYLGVPTTNAPGSLHASADLVGRTLHDVMPREQADGFLAPIREALAQRRTQTFEYPLEVEGQERWFSANVSPMTADAVVVVAREVSEAKLARAALEETVRQLAEREGQYRSIFEATTESLLIHAPGDLTIMEANQASAKMFGYTREELRGMSPADLFQESSYDPEFVNAARDGVPRHTPAIGVRKDGSTFDIEATGVSFLFKGEPHLLCLQRDVTEMKRTQASLQETIAQLAEKEENYRSIFEAATDGIGISDAETGLGLAANPAFCRMHGYDDMVGMHPMVYIHPNSHHLFLKFREEVLAGREFRARAQDVRRDGSVFDVEVIGRGFTYQGTFALLGLVRDITEQVRAEQLLEQRVADRTQEIESLLNLAKVVNSTLDLNELVRLILRQLREVVDFSSASLVLLEDEQNVVIHDLVLAAAGGDEAEDGTTLQVTTARSSSAAPGNDPVFGRQMDDGEAVIASEVSPGPGESAGLRFTRSWMAVPLTLQDRRLGYLGISSDRPDYFSEKHARLAQAFADHASVAIENARQYERAQELAAMDERQRLARDLHDSVAQALYGIALGARTARKYLDVDAAAAVEPVDYVLSLASAGLAEMRALIFDLHPDSLQREGLVNAIGRQVNALQARHGIEVEWQPCEEPDVPVAVKEAVYRIVREAMHNVVKHAQAHRVSVLLEASPAHIRFEVKDDGIGFDPALDKPGHLGLRSMRERAERLRGRVTLQSRPQKGTTVEGIVPL